MKAASGNSSGSSTLSTRRTRGSETPIITFRRDGAPDDEEAIFGTDDGELVERVRSMGVTEYSVSRGTLEDVYLTLTEQKGAQNGNC